MLTVWGRATSSNVQKVMWVIGELGLPYKRIDVGGAFGGLDTPEYRKLNPTSRIPTVEFGDGRVMWESSAIMRHLAMTDPERRLWPAEGQPALDADMLSEWSQIYSSSVITQLFWAVVRTKPSERDPALIARHSAALEPALKLADAKLSEHPFLAGDRLTIADISFGHTLYRYFTMETERPDVPHVAAYYESLTARPAYAEHVMVDYSSLRVTD